MVRLSICDMCKHLWPDRTDAACPAFPEGRRTFEEHFPPVNQSCGNGVRFEPNEESKHLWDEQMYKAFSRPTEEDLEWEVSVGQG